MNIFKEIPPTAGLPIYIKDSLALFNRNTRRGSLEEDFKKYLGLDYIRVACSGTASFYLILESLKEVSFKKTVVIPSFICPLVPLAIERAGLRAEVCDINYADFGFNLTELKKICSDNSDILAVVPAHLAGIPVDFESLERIIKPYKIFSIEDCAQSLGAVYKGKKAGSLGDFAFFSLCRGKGLTIYEGGAIAASRKEYARVIDDKLAQLVKDDGLSEGIKLLELFGYWLFYRPQLFWFVFGLPQAFWMLKKREAKAYQEEFALNFPLHKVSAARKTFGHVSFYRLAEEIKKQRRKAEYYLRGLKGIEGVRAIEEPSGALATYPYLTLIFQDSARRLVTQRALERRGLGGSLIYTSAIADYGYLKGIVTQRDSPAGRFIAGNHLTLSTSTFLKFRDLDEVLKIVKGC